MTNSFFETRETLNYLHTVNFETLHLLSVSASMSTTQCPPFSRQVKSRHFLFTDHFLGMIEILETSAGNCSYFTEYRWAWWNVGSRLCSLFQWNWWQLHLWRWERFDLEPIFFETVSILCRTTHWLLQHLRKIWMFDTICQRLNQLDKNYQW